MQKVRSLWLFLCLTVASGMAEAQDSPKAMSLREALSYALTHHPTVDRAKLEIAQGEQKLIEYKSEGLPQLSANGQFQYNPKLATQYIPDFFSGNLDELIPVQFGTRYNINGGIQLSQMVYDQRYWLGTRAGKKLNELNGLQLEKTKEDLAYQTAQLYWQILFTHQQQSNIEASLEQTRQLLTTVEAQYRNGLARRIDVDQLKVNLVNLETQLSNLRVQEESLLQNLKINLSLPPDAPLDLTDSLQHAENLFVAATPAPSHINLNLLGKQRELQEISILNEKSAYYPRANVFANFNVQWQDNALSALGNNQRWANFSSVGISLHVPIFDGFRTPSRVEQARIELLQLETDRRYTEMMLRQQALNASTQIRSYENNLRAGDENRRVAHDTYLAVEGQYRQGLATVTELLNAQTAWRQAENNYLTTLLQLRAGQLDLLYAQGNIMTLLKQD